MNRNEQLTNTSKTNVMNYQPLTNPIGNQKLIDAIMQHVSNKRKCEKSTIAYMIGMMDAHNVYAHTPEFSKRADVVAMFEILIKTEKIKYLNNGYCLTEIFSQFQDATISKNEMERKLTSPEKSDESDKKEIQLKCGSEIIITKSDDVEISIERSCDGKTLKLIRTTKSGWEIFKTINL